MPFVRAETLIHIETDGVILTENIKEWGLEVRIFTKIIPNFGGTYGVMKMWDVSHYIFHNGMELPHFCRDCDFTTKEAENVG